MPMAMVLLRCMRNRRAEALGVYLSRLIDAATSLRVAGLTMSGLLMQLDTVCGETPASRATSLMLTMGPPWGVFVVPERGVAAVAGSAAPIAPAVAVRHARRATVPACRCERCANAIVTFQSHA